MKKLIFFCIVLLSFLAGNSQTVNPIIGKYRYRFLSVDTLIVPNGTTAQRPSAANGPGLYYNSDSSKIQFSNGTFWTTLGSVSGGAANLPVGGNFNVAIAGTNNVKGIGQRYGIVLDSATANNIYFTIDTNHVTGLSTVYWRQKGVDSLSTIITTGLAGKQATLISGTNIKTINGQSLLGAGDLATVGGTGVTDTTALLRKGNNLADLSSVSTAKTNLGLNNVDNTSDATKNSATASLTNKTIVIGSNHITGTAGKAAQFNASTGDLETATTTTTELGYLSGTTSGIQGQLNGKAPSIRALTINGVTYDLSADRSWTVPGATNTPVGTNYKLAISGTNNIKGITPGYGVLADSATANNVNFKADTATLFPAVRSTITVIDTTSLSNRINTKLSNGATVGGDLTGSLPNPTLTNTTVSAGTYNNATVVIDAKGRIQSATSGVAGTDSALIAGSGISISKLGTARTAKLDTGFISTYYLPNHPVNLPIDTTHGLRLSPGSGGAPDTLRLAYNGTGGSVTLDAAPTAGSTSNAPTSGGTFTALQLRNEALNVINVGQHGIAPGSNISANFQALLSAGYKKFYFPTGNYKVDTLITFANTDGIEISGDGFNKTIFTSTVSKQIFFFSGKTTNLVLNASFRVETRVSSTTDDATGVIYFYTNGATDTCRNIKLFCSVKSPLAKIDGIHMVSEGTASMMENVVALPLLDSIGRLGFEVQNHLDRTVIRYRNIRADNGTYTNIGTVTTGVKNCAISFSGPGMYCTANGNYIQDVNEASGFAYNIGIENAGCKYFISNGNTFKTINHGFVAIEGTDTGHLTDYWTCMNNSGYLASHIDSNSARGIYVTAVHHSTFSGNNFTSNSYAYQFVDCSDNIISNNQGVSNYDPVVMRFSGYSQRNKISENYLNDSSTAYNNANIIFDGINTHDNHAPGNKLINNTGGRGIMASINSAYNNDPYYRVDGRVFGSYAGSPEGHVVSEIGGLITDNTNGDIYKKTSGSGNTGWVLVTTGGLSSLGYGLAGTTTVPKVDTTTIDARYKKIFNVKNWGAVGNGSTNDQAAVAATMAALYASGSGILYFPAGIYLIDSLVIPAAPGPDRFYFEIDGESSPSFLFGTAGANTMPNHASVIKSNATSGSVIIAKPLAGNFSYTNVVIKDVEVRTYDNPSNNGIDLSWTPFCRLENVFISTGVYNVTASQPTHGTAGLLTPVRGNGAQTILNNVTVTGYYDGIQVNEHVDGNGINVASCINGLNIQAADHISHITRYGAYRNHYNITVSGAQVFAIDQMAIEHADSATQTSSTTRWQITYADLKDPSNLGQGDINYGTVLGNTGFVHSFLKTGGTGVNAREIGASSAGLSIGLPVSSGTAGSNLFVDGSGNLGQDNANHFWDNTNKRLGIRTNTPTEVVHVKDNYNGSLRGLIENSSSGTGAASTWSVKNNTAHLSQFGITGLGYTPYGSLTNNMSYFYTSNLHNILMADTVGSDWQIATGGNATKFTFGGTGGFRMHAYGTGAKSGTAAYGLFVDASGNVIEGTTSGSSQWTTTGSDIYFGNKVMIGSTTAPSAPLHIIAPSSSGYGQFSIQANSGTAGTSLAYMSWRDGAGTRMMVEGYGQYGGSPDLNFYYANEINGSYVWRNSAAQIAELTTGGNLGLGITPTQKLHLYNSASTTKALIESGDAASLAGVDFKVNGVNLGSLRGVGSAAGSAPYNNSSLSLYGTSAGGTSIGNGSTSGYVSIITNNGADVERMRIAANGYISTTATPVGSVTDYILTKGPDSIMRRITTATLFTSPALTGSPTAPTKTQNDNTTNIATTAYVDRAAGYTTVVVVSTGTTTLSQWKFNWVNIDPSSVISTETINLPASPNDGDIVRITAGGTIAVSSAVVTTFTLNGNGHTIYGTAAPSSLTGGQSLEYQYYGVWKRIQLP